ncbi:Swt1 family HEPN domain-containing protein [Pseudomonas capeferrum]
MAFEATVKAFGMTNMLIESEIDQLEKSLSIRLRNEISKEEGLNDIEKAYFPQFAESLRDEAAEMARSYELFYCLEKTIRRQITELLESNHGPNWWNNKVIPQQVFNEVKTRIQRERDSGITPRSSEQLDYTNFGELGEIIKSNWQLFASVFNNIKAVEKIMSNLNSLRNPIAHCSILAEDEKLRLDLSLRDWFRLAE